MTYSGAFLVPWIGKNRASHPQKNVRANSTILVACD
jgi:hypothetical protein